MKIKNKAMLGLGIIGVCLLLVSCASVQMDAKNLKEKLEGLNVIIRTFDEESRIIDKIEGKSVMVSRDTKFDSYTDGSSNKDSSVIEITIGSNSITHVGSSLIMSEKGLTDIFDDYAETVDITNMDRGTPFINKIVNNYKNLTSGKDKTILIRSQNGTPLATYLGNSVSIFSSDVPKTTVLLVDGKVLLIYRCDYTIYDTELILE